MLPKTRTGPTIITIFGARGDLTSRKLIPALYHLDIDGWLNEKTAIIGVDRKLTTHDQLRDLVREGFDKFSRTGKSKEELWTRFIKRVYLHHGEAEESACYAALAARIAEIEKAWGEPAAKVYYLSTPPSLISVIPKHLAEAGLAADQKRSRIVIEKPFGTDLDSARALNRDLTAHFAEPQIFRIDHYLGKETVQNILAFRFANALFEPTWDRRYIDHVQVTVAEAIGVGGRGGYYEGAGAVRDMIQNHLLQLMSLVAMEPPISFDADEIRSKKVDVLRAIRPITSETLHKFAVRGQYGEGWIEGQKAAAYTSETNVSPNSATETFAALKLHVDNWRWQGVPFYLRTGKRMPVQSSELSIHFRPAPHQTFPTSASTAWRPNRLILRLQPEEGIILAFQAKHPGQPLRLAPVEMRFSYNEAFQASAREAYETLLLDAMLGDSTLFLRGDHVELSWAVVMPVLNGWAENPPTSFPNYQSGTWGPEAAEVLIAQDGRSWLQHAMSETTRAKR